MHEITNLLDRISHPDMDYAVLYPAVIAGHVTWLVMSFRQRDRASMFSQEHPASMVFIRDHEHPNRDWTRI